MKTKSEENLKGTLFSVIFIGVIIIVMWMSIYLLYIGRT
ncbi:cytochrome c oxidase subunit 2A [Halobacillus seohaensis]|uniref:Cytochrome c oxidase subunit 2A n=1 Tax=Halobacillus seohaensis TaxID=447421 RepID=A0ABW2EHS9_9BACI